MKRFLAPLATPLKAAFLVVIFARFHGSWVGAIVVLGLAALLFGLDRAARRWAQRALGALK